MMVMLRLSPALIGSVFSCIFSCVIKVCVKYCKEMWAPKVTTWRGVIWPRDSLLLGGRGREQREPRERERGAGA
jgi:hypothetical protein